MVQRIRKHDYNKGQSNVINLKKRQKKQSVSTINRHTENRGKIS